MNPSVTMIMAEYDQKADSYGRNCINSISKSEERFSFFSNNDELNKVKKRLSCEPKCGDQRTIVEFLEFYKID